MTGTHGAAMPEALYMTCSASAMAYLKARDRKLGEAIDRIGGIRRRVWPDSLIGLLRAVVGQMISSKTQESIWNRFMAAHAPITAEKIAGLPIEAIRQCGIPASRAACMLDIAARFASGALNARELAAMSDDELCARLTAIRGVGAWTAQMLLIFTFQRPNVFSPGDLAIGRGLRMLHGLSEITPAMFRRFHTLYTPHATTASLYLWEVAGGRLPGLADPAIRGKARRRA